MIFLLHKHLYWTQSLYAKYAQTSNHDTKLLIFEYLFFYSIIIDAITCKHFNIFNFNLMLLKNFSKKVFRHIKDWLLYKSSLTCSSTSNKYECM